MCSEGSETNAVEQALIDEFSTPLIAPELKVFGDAIHDKLAELRAKRTSLSNELDETNRQIEETERELSCLHESSLIINRLRPSDEATAKLALNITEMDFSQRTFNCLYRVGLTTLGAINDATVSDLTSIRGFGKKSLAAVNDQLTRYGLEPKYLPSNHQ